MFPNRSWISRRQSTASFCPDVIRSEKVVQIGARKINGKIKKEQILEKRLKCNHTNCNLEKIFIICEELFNLGSDRLK